MGVEMGSGPSRVNEIHEVGFVADARLISILGEQLIGSEKIGVLELVKNAYDAGAATCKVTIEGVPGLPSRPRDLKDYTELPGPIIEVRDDGSGMNRDAIVSGWLRPATGSRAHVKDRLRRERERALTEGSLAEYESLAEAIRAEQGGRLPLGEKGIGRLATHRLGEHLWLRTKTADQPFEWELRIAWGLFDGTEDGPRDLSSIRLELKSQAPTANYGDRASGTVICCYGGRAGYPWNEELVKEIGQAVVALRSPRQDSRFVPSFKAPQLAQEVAAPLERLEAPFELHAIVDETGMAEIEMSFRPPPHLDLKPKPAQERFKSDLRRKDKDYWEDRNLQWKRPACGPFYVHIRLWFRDRAWLGPDFSSITESLDRFGGLAVYRDGILSQATQLSSSSDWLGLTTRQIKKGSRISYYQMLGEIELDQSKNVGLLDRSNREGMIETRAFADLGQLTRSVIDHLEIFTRDVRDKLKKLTRVERVAVASLKAESRLAADVLLALVNRYEFKKDPLELLKIAKSKRRLEATSQRLRGLQDYLDLKDDELDGLVEAAGFGLAIAVGVHELGKLASAIEANARWLVERPTSSDLPARLEDISKNAESLLSEVGRLEPLRTTRTAPKRPTTARRLVELARNALALSLENAGVDLSFQGTDFPISVKVGAAAQVFANLIDNSIYWLRGMGQRGAQIRILLDPTARSVLFADSGPGLSASIRPHVFKPFFSEKSPPSGLGLYICRHLLAQEDATIRLAQQSERCDLPGAQFVVDFSRTPEGNQ